MWLRATSYPFRVDARAVAVEPNGQLESVHGDRDRECTRAARADGDTLERLPLKRRERLGHLLCALGETAAAWQPPVRLQRRLLALRPVDTANPAAPEPELDQLLQRL